MFRLIGFVFGSAISIGAILLILGIPQFHLSNPNLDKARFDEAVEKLKEKSKDAEAVAREVADKAGETVTELRAAAAQATDADVQAAAPVEIPEEEAGSDAPPPVEAADPVTEPVFGIPEDTQPVVFETHWHPFWNPFRSKIAATGFVSQLEKVTGLDYRVVKVKTGVYQVAFAYGSDEERRTRLSQISAATGLDLPES